MSAALDWNLWWPFFVTLAVGATLIVAGTLLMQRWIRPMTWLRTIWQVTFLSLGLLAISEISGAGRAIWSWMPHPSQSEPEGQRLVESKIIGEPDLRMLLAQRSQQFAPSASSPPAAVPKQEPVEWPAAIWLMGFVVALAWMVIARLVFLIFVPRRRVRDVNLLTRVDAIARRLGVMKRVRVSETRSLAGPIAFGIFRPGISLPKGFASRFTHEQQDAMLAHELAHLAARDPFWHALADGVTAVLWWNPLAWFAKRELHAASEGAADEASLVVENGPNLLAECLVELGGRLTRTHSLGWLGMAGADFRSGLGRRVKRLLSLNDRPWEPAQSSRAWLVRMAVPIVLVAIALTATMWAQAPLAGPSTLREAFQRSVLGLALAAALPQATAAEAERDLIDWQPWSSETLAAARKEGKMVLVHFGDDRVESARVNEQTSFEVPAVGAKLLESGAIALRGDHTQSDETIANERLAFDRAGVPLTLVYPSNPTLPPEVLPQFLTPQIVLEALARGSTPTEKMASKTATGSATSDQNRAPALILHGRSLQQAGRLAEARAKFEEALKLDPANLAAKHYLSLLLQAAAPPGTNSSSRTNLVRSNRGREAIIQESDVDDIIKDRIREQFGDRTNFIRFLQAEQITYETYRQRERDRIINLDSIRLEEVSFPGLPLNEVVEKLAAMVAAAYREHKGINFLVTTNDIIHLDRPLRNATLRQTLDAIVRSAETSLTYSVEDYAVVISPGPPRPALHTRWFKIDADTFSRALFGSLKTNATEAARRFFTTAAVDFTVPGKAIIFNDRLGQLMVRATLQDLDIIERTIQRIHTPPSQLTIEVKFAEITESDSKALGFDWFLGNTLTQNSGLGPQSRLGTSVGVADTSGVSPAASTDNLQVLSHAPLFQRFYRAASPSGIGTNGPENETSIGVLTDAQFRVVLRALEQRQGVNILTLPKVTTLSGRQAQMKTVNVRYVVTDLDFSHIVSNATAEATGEAQPKPVAEQFELGPVLDVVPYVQPDGYTIQMTVIPTFKEFLGYDVENARLVPPEAKSADLQQLTPLPIFRLRQIVASVTAFDGQTVVLAGGSDRLLANPNKNEPLREGTKPPQPPKKTKLLIFVTPTLIDPAGNRIHSPEDVPRGDPRQASTPP